MAKNVDTMSERQFAKHTGKALSTVQEARRAGRLSRSVKRDAKGRIRIDPALAAEELAATRRLRITDDDARGDARTIKAWRAARARREAALAAIAEDQLAVNRGDLVDAKAIESAIVDVFTRSRNRLMGVPSKLKQRCPDLATPHIAVIEDLIREALEELAEGIEAEGKLRGS